MAITIPASWELQEEREISPARPIVDTSDHDLQALNQRINRAMAATTRIIAQGGIGPNGTGRYHDEAGVTSYASRYKGSCHIWRDPTILRLVVYGQNCDVYARLGSATVATVNCGATLGFYASAAFDATGFLRIGTSLATIELLARQNASSGTRIWSAWTLEEMPMTALPDADDTTFERLDDAALGADVPLDGFLLQRLADNCNELRLRTRGTAQVWPVDDPFTVSSIRWRCDGPYTIFAEPWVESASVAVHVEATAADIEVMAFSEWEDKYIAIDRAVTVTAGAGETTVEFIGIRVKSSDLGYTENRIWIGIRCSTGSTVRPHTVYLWRTTGKRDIQLIDTGSSVATTESIGWPVGWCLTESSEMVGFSSGAKGDLSQVGVNVAFDLAANLTRPVSFGVGNAGQQLLASNCRDAQRVERYNAVYIRNVGILSIYSVSIIGESPKDSLTSLALQSYAAEGEPPPWVVPAEMAAVANWYARWATVQLGIRQRGQRWLHGSAAGSAVTRYQEGRYSFAPTPSLDGVMEWWMLPSSPAVGSGIDPTQLRCRVVYYLVDAGSPDGDEAITWNLKNGATLLGSTAATEQAAGATSEQSSVTLWDAALSAVAAGVDSTDVYEHCYVQQLSWLGEEFEGDGQAGGRKLWSTVEIIGDLPASYPCFVTLTMTSAASTCWVVVVGAALDVLERS